MVDPVLCRRASRRGPNYETASAGENQRPLRKVEVDLQLAARFGGCKLTRATRAHAAGPLFVTFARCCAVARQRGVRSAEKRAVRLDRKYARRAERRGAAAAREEAEEVEQ